MAAKQTKRRRPPTNTELMFAIEGWRNEDRAEVNRRMKGMNDVILSLASKDDIAGVKQDVSNLSAAIFDEKSELKIATKADVQPVVDWHRNLVAAARFTSIGGTWTSRIILGIATILLALGVIKGGLAHALAWLLNSAKM